MAWPVVAAMAAGAVLSHQRSQQQEAAQRAQMKKAQKQEAAKARYSPWTGFAPNTSRINEPNVDYWGNMMQGMAAGAQFGSQFSGGGADAGDDGYSYVDDTGTHYVPGYYQQYGRQSQNMGGGMYRTNY